MQLNQVRNRRWSLSEVSGDRLTLSVPGIIENLLVSLGYEIVFLSTRVRRQNSFGYVKKWNTIE
jgi:hypothetical protein